MARGVKERVVGTVATAAELARHLVWYLSYQMDGSARTDESATKLRDRSES